MEIKERVKTLVGVLKTSTNLKEDEVKAVEELESVALYTLEKFGDRDALDINLTPSEYEDTFILGIYIDNKINKVFLKSTNTDIDFSILNK